MFIDKDILLYFDLPGFLISRLVRGINKYAPFL